jgi:hypothetical protein
MSPSKTTNISLNIINPTAFAMETSLLSAFISILAEDKLSYSPLKKYSVSYNPQSSFSFHLSPYTFRASFYSSKL